MSTRTTRTHPAFGKEVHERPVVQVWGRRAMVSSMHPDATLAGLDVLRAGGNAVDAAVATAAALAVTNHNWSGLAGDTAWLIYARKPNSLFHLDAYCTCPREMTSEQLCAAFELRRSATLAAFGAEPFAQRDVGLVTSMAPGTPAGLHAAWRRFGTKPFEDLLARAISLAEDGVVVSDYVAGSLEKCREKLALFPSSRAIFFAANGEPFGEGDTLRQPDLALTLKRYAADPENDFSSGRTATLISRHARTAGAPLCADDLARYRPAWRTPVEGSYRGYRVAVTAPPTAGVHVLQSLNILENLALRTLPYHGADELHLMIEALKHALADRRRYGGDPDHDDIPVSRLVDKDAARPISDQIRSAGMAAVKNGRGSSASETTHFAIIDEDGNAVSATQSIGNDFGCGEVIDGTGLVMNDRSWWMSLDQEPNRVAPGRRVNIGHAPTIVFADNLPWIVLGSPGGFGIVPYVVQTLVNMIDHDFDLQSAIEAARFRVMDLAGEVAFESRFDPAALASLRDRGHLVTLFPAWTDRVGGVAGITRDSRTGALLGGYDPRRNSYAAGF